MKRRWSSLLIFSKYGLYFGACVGLIPVLMNLLTTGFTKNIGIALNSLPITLFIGSTVGTVFGFIFGLICDFLKQCSNDVGALRYRLIRITVAIFIPAITSWLVFERLLRNTEGRGLEIVFSILFGCVGLAGGVAGDQLFVKRAREDETDVIVTSPSSQSAHQENLRTPESGCRFIAGINLGLGFVSYVIIFVVILSVSGVAFVVGDRLIWTKTFNGKIFTVVRGDTMDVMSLGIILPLVNTPIRGKIKRIKLDGVESPTFDQPFGDEARDFVSELVLNKKVRVEWQGQIKRSYLPENTARVFLMDGRELNREIVREGYGWCSQSEDNTPLKQLETEARIARRGLWADDNPIPPREWWLSPESSKVDVTPDTSEYHLVGNGHRHSKGPTFFKMRKKAQVKYKPCPICYPLGDSAQVSSAADALSGHRKNQERLARQKGSETQIDRPHDSTIATEFNLMVVGGEATEFLLKDSSGKKTGFTAEGMSLRMIPKSRWEANAPKPDSGGPYQRITLDPPTPGTYRFTMAKSQNRFDFLAYVNFKSGGKILSVSCVGYALPGVVQTFDLQLAEAGDNLALSVPIEDLRANKRRAGFYFEIENPPSREVVVEDPQGRRFGRNAINLQSYQDLQGVTLGTTDNGQTNQQRVWGLAWVAQPGTYKIFVSQYSNTDQNAPRDPRPYKLFLTRWPARGPLAGVQTMEGAISWGEGQTVNVEVER